MRNGLILLLFFFYIASCTQNSVQHESITPHPNSDHIYQIHILKMRAPELASNFPFALPNPGEIDASLNAKITLHYIENREEAKTLLQKLNGLPVDLLVGVNTELFSLFKELKLPVVNNRTSAFLFSEAQTQVPPQVLPIKFDPAKILSFEKMLCQEFLCSESFYKKFPKLRRAPKESRPIHFVRGFEEHTTRSNYLKYTINWQDLLSTLLNSKPHDGLELSIENGNIRLNYADSLKVPLQKILLKQLNAGGI